MLYLEDYMEMIENLPMEMRDRFTDMREMDLQVQNTMDSTDEQMKNFFKKCATTPSLKKEWRDEQFARIKAEYSKALDDSDEKVQLATTIYDLLERYLRKLDQELAKFKMELEADSAGITEILEKRSLELDRPPTNHNNHRAEKRKYSSMMGGGGGVHGNAEKRHHNHTPTLEPSHKELTATYSGISSLATREPMALSRGSSSAAPSPGMPMFSSAQVVSSSAAASSTTPALSYSLGHVGAGSNAAIAAAASRAIGATLEMQQGRRTASLKASYEAAQRGQSAFASFPQQSSSSASASSQQQATASSFSAADIPPPPPTTKVARQKKSRAQQQAARQAAAAAAAAAAAQQAAQAAAPSLEQSALGAALQASTPTAESLDVGGTTSAAGTGDESVSSQWPYDPNEPRYCVCNDVSYGDMVGCDNNDCTIEWFHYGCVGLAQAPKGKWYCPNCVSAMKRRGRK